MIGSSSELHAICIGFLRCFRPAVTPDSRRSIWRIFAILALLLLFVREACASFDQISLRDGQTLNGKLLSEQRNEYLFQPNTPGATVRRIPKQAVRFVIYSDPARANQALGISRARRLTESGLSVAGILPAKPFGQAILGAVKGAQTSIWITAYFISGSRTSPIRDFYETLQRKAQEGVEVIVISEFGPGTSAHVRNTTFNFARELGRAGIQVRFMRERRVLYKKLIIVDGKAVFLGSANLTMSGTLRNNEINVRIVDPSFARRATEDFRRMLALSKGAADAQ